MPLDLRESKVIEEMDLLEQELLQRKRTGEEIRQRSEELAALNTIAETVSGSLDLDEILNSALDKVLEVTDFEAGGIALVDEAEGKIIPVVHRHVPEAFLATFAELRAGGEFRWQTVESGESIFFEDISHDPQLRGHAGLKEGFYAAAYIPLKVRDRVIGFMGLGTRGEHHFTPQEKALFTTIANQIGVAIENARLYKESKEHARSLEHINERLLTLQQISASVTSTLDLQEVLKTIQKSMLALFEESYPPIFGLLNQEEQVIHPIIVGEYSEHLEKLKRAAGRGLEELSFPMEKMTPEVREALFARKPYVTRDAVDIFAHPPIRGFALAVQKAFRVKTLIELPLWTKTEFLGVMFLTSRRDEVSHEELGLLMAFADQAAIAIENARLFEEEKRRATQLALISEVGQKAVSILDLDRLMQEVTRSIREKFNYYHVAFFLLGEERGEVAIRAVTSDFEPIMVTREYRQSIDEGIIGFVTKTGRSWLANDVSKDPYYIKGHLKGVSIKSELCVPIQLGEDVIGVLDIQSIHLNAFDETDVTAMETLSGQIAIAIENARLYREAQRRMEELFNLSKSSQVIASSLDVQTVLSEIVSLAGQVANSAYTSVVLVDEDGELSRSVEDFSGIAPLHHRARPRGVTRRIINTAEPVIIDQVLDDGTHNPAVVTAGIKSYAGLPIMTKGKILGVLFVHSLNPYTFSDRIPLLTTFANQAAIAIENARLYEEAQARSTYLATLQRINATLRSTLPLSQVLETIVQGTGEALGYVGSFIVIPDATGERLTLGAAWGGQVMDAALKVTPLKLESFSVPVKVRENLIARAFVNGELQVSSGEPESLAVGTEPAIRTRMARVIERITGARGAACVPLRVAEKTVGVLIIVSPREQLSNEEQAMLLGLADQAGLAIENARLYEERKRKAEELAVLNEIGRAVTSVMQLDDLLELISQEASRVIDTSNLSIALYDAKKNEVSFPLYFEEGERRRLEKRPARRGMTEYVINSAKPLMINHDLVSRLKELDVELIGRPSKSWLGVPMLSEDQVIGILAIQDYQNENAYDESHLRLLSTIASQAAIAIENARLYSETIDSRDKAEWHGERMRTLQEIATSMTGTLSLDEVLQRIANGALKSLRTHAVGLFAVNERDNTLELVAAVTSLGKGIIARLEKTMGMRTRNVKLPIKEGQNMLVDAVIHKKIVLGQDFIPGMMGPRPVLALLQKSLRIQAITVLPLLVKDKAVGAITFPTPPQEEITDGERRLMAIFANQASIAIENARLFQTVVRGKKEWEETFDSVTDGVYLIDSNRTLIRVNRALAASFGTVPGELIGRKCYEAIHGFDEPWSECPLREVLETKQVIVREAEDPRTGRILQLSVYPRLDDEGNVVGSVHVVRDITERRAREKEVERRNRELAALNTIGITVTSTLNLQEVLQSIQKRTMELLGEKYGPIFALFNEANQTLDVTLTHLQEDVVRRVDRLIGAKFGELSLPLSTLKPALREAMLEGKPYVTDDASDFLTRRIGKRLIKGAQIAMGVKCIVALPLRVKGKLIGTMLLFSQREKVLEEDMELLSGVANQAAIAIENAQAYERLKTQNLETISALAAAVEAKDPYTGGHSEEVTQFAVAIAEKMGLADDEIEDLQVAALLHDIGKIGVPDSVLNKPARLTPAEFLMIKAHPVIAGEIVGRVEALAHLVPIIRHHHERYDGQGYPGGLKGEEIPLGARILAVADGFDAMTSDRPYRGAMPTQEALAELQRGAGTQWDPEVVKVFMKMHKEGALKHQAGRQ